MREGKRESGAKFADYFDFAEPFTSLPSHRILALFRGEKEEVLALTLDPEPEDAAEPGPSGYEVRIAETFGIADRGRPADRWLLDTVRWAWRTRILVHLGIDLRARLWQAGRGRGGAGVRRQPARPAARRARRAAATMGLDPGLRTGVKVAVVDGTGKVVDTATIYPHEPQRRWEEALADAGAARHASTTSSWSRSATARPPGRPTGSRPS